MTNGFPLWVLAASILAVWQPGAFTWFSRSWFPWGLGMIMLGMGLTLTPESFRAIRRYPGWVLGGALFQFTLMPLLGWSLAHLFGLGAATATGLVLVASCPGGTASNVIAFLARANTALSVTMTAVSTLSAIMFTPLLTVFLAGDFALLSGAGGEVRLDINGWALFRQTALVVLAPVLAGLLLRRYLPGFSRRILPLAPLTAVVFIVLIVAAMIGYSVEGPQRELFFEKAPILLTVVFLLHGSGFLLGYGLSRFLFRNEAVARTISIEVGMQNSGLGIVLAGQIPTAANPHPLVALPSAFSSITHCLIGSLASSLWSRRPPAEEPANP